MELAAAPNIWDSIFDGLLIASMVVLFAELACNIICRPRFHELEIFMDFIAAGSVAADFSWSRQQLRGSDSHTGIRLETATIVAARAGRVVRLLRMFRLSKFSKSLIAMAVKYIRRGRETRPLDEDVTIGKRLTDINTLQVSGSLHCCNAIQSSLMSTRAHSLGQYLVHQWCNLIHISLQC